MDDQVTARTLVCAIPKGIINSWLLKQFTEMGRQLTEATSILKPGMGPDDAQARKYGAIHLLFDSVSVSAFRVYTHGFQSLSAGSAGALVIVRTTGQRHAATTGPSFWPLRYSFIAAGKDFARPRHFRHSVCRLVGRSSGSCLHGRSSCCTLLRSADAIGRYGIGADPRRIAGTRIGTGNEQNGPDTSLRRAARRCPLASVVTVFAGICTRARTRARARNERSTLS
jgi:hypothetical protein